MPWWRSLYIIVRDTWNRSQTGEASVRAGWADFVGSVLTLGGRIVMSPSDAAYRRARVLLALIIALLIALAIALLAARLPFWELMQLL